MSIVRWPAMVATGGLLLLGCGRLPATNYGTVSGTVMAGPTCPVEQVGSPCPNRPLQTTVLILSRSGQVVTSARSDVHGRYSVHVAPGTYFVAVQTPVWPRCPATRVVVEDSGSTRANVLCDTGIR